MRALSKPIRDVIAKSKDLVATHQQLWLPDSSRSMGIHLQAGKGSGKSRLMGRMIAWFDFLRGIPQVIFDPHGSTIDNFLDKLIRMPRKWQERLWPRVLYVDMSGKSGRVVPFPLYYRLGAESLYDISQRYLDVLRKIDPFLQTASVEGWNPLWLTGTHCGMLLAALGFQVSEAESLLRNPLGWLADFQRALEVNHDTASAVTFFRQLGEAKESIRERQIQSFFNKIALFSLDPSMRAMFGASLPGINWKHVENQGMAVLLDFRHEHGIERKRFKMMWAFNYFMDFVKSRGAGRHKPISLIVDELTSLFSVQSLAVDLFVAEVDDLINVIARNYSIWLCIAHQELFQFSEGLQKTLMTMGTQILGNTSDQKAALDLASHFFRYNPYLVKKREPVYGSFLGFPVELDTTTVEFTIEEQLLMHSYRFKDQGLFKFLVRPALGEGDVRGNLLQISIAGFDPGEFPDDSIVAEARRLLISRDGIEITELLAEINQRFDMAKLEKPTEDDIGKPRSERDIPFWGA